jgi:hypothetical protein
VGTVVTEGEVLSVEMDEEQGEDEDDQDRHAKQAYDEEKVWTVRSSLFDFHAECDAEAGGTVAKAAM